ncbi:uncharacterized protein ISCGN_005585 [Ixodes scapularis]
MKARTAPHTISAAIATAMSVTDPAAIASSPQSMETFEGKTSQKTVALAPRQTTAMTIIMKTTDNFNLSTIPLIVISNQIRTTAQLTKQERLDTYIKLRAPQNLIAIDTYRPTAAEKIMALQHIAIQDKLHPLSTYIANDPNNARAVIHGIPLDVTDATIKEELYIQGRRIINFRRLGTTYTLLLTVEGPTIPRYAIFSSGVYKLYPPKPLYRLCLYCFSLQHRSDVCPNRTEYVCCANCGQKFPPSQNPSETPHECDTKCINCQGEHAATDPQCPRRTEINNNAGRRAEPRRLQPPRPPPQRDSLTDWPDLPTNNRYALLASHHRSRSRSRSFSRNRSQSRTSCVQDRHTPKKKIPPLLKPKVRFAEAMNPSWEKSAARVASAPFRRTRNNSQESVTETPIFETLQKEWLPLPVIVPHSSQSTTTDPEAGAEPLTVQARARRLSQLARLSTTLPGRWFLQRIQARTKGSRHDSVEDFLNIAGPLPTMTNKARVAPWEVAKVSIELRIKRLRAKKVGPINALREAVEKHIEERYGSWLQIYTDGSVNKARTSSTAAFYIPELALEWCGRLQAPTSSTTAELVAIDKALQAAAQLSPHRMVLLTDSRCALQKLANAECADPATTAARQTLSFLLTHGSTVCFQWIPGHTGIKGNERADSLAGEAHLAPRTVPTPPHPQQAALNVHWHLQDSKPKPALPRGALSGLSRAAQTLVRRLRTNTAYTNAFLTKTGTGQHPLCSQCNSAETVEHILCVCPAYETQRAALRKRLGKSDLTTNDILAPDGSGRKCQNILKAMLAFLRDTKTITRL